MILLAALSFQCVPLWTHDGDNVRCSSGINIRLAGINAREIGWNGHSSFDKGCRTNAPCPSVDAVTARDRLAELIGKPLYIDAHGNEHVSGPALTCVSNGTSYKRIAAWCTTGGVDVSCVMAARGYAAVWARYWKGHRCG